MRLALYQPDIPQNLGGALRLSACMGLPVEIIEPCGFIFYDKRIRRAGMDYMEQVVLTQHENWDTFCAWQQKQNGRVVLLTTKGSEPLPDFTFQPDDILLAGRESAGVPDEVAQYADARVRIPMMPDARSLNVVVSIGMVLTEALRQTQQWPME